MGISLAKEFSAPRALMKDWQPHSVPPCKGKSGISISRSAMHM